MNNTDKLLKLLEAFIEASGFDIETIVDTKLTPISKQAGVHMIATRRYSELETINGNEYKRGDDECYYLKSSLDVYYKVTKEINKSVSLQILHHKKEIARLIKDNENI